MQKIITVQALEREGFTLGYTLEFPNGLLLKVIAGRTYYDWLHAASREQALQRMRELAVLLEQDGWQIQGDLSWKSS